MRRGWWTQNRRDWLAMIMIVAGVVSIIVGYRLSVGLPPW